MSHVISLLDRTFLICSHITVLHAIWMRRWALVQQNSSPLNYEKYSRQVYRNLKSIIAYFEGRTLFLQNSSAVTGRVPGVFQFLLLPSRELRFNCWIIPQICYEARISACFRFLRLKIEIWNSIRVLGKDATLNSRNSIKTFKHHVQPYTII